MELYEKLTTKEAFDKYWQSHYIPVSYKDVQEAFESFVKEQDKKIFIEDYEANGQISKDNFIENLHADAQFAFQDALTMAFYDKNPELYEAAFTIYEMEQMEGKKGTITILFHETYALLYQTFLNQMFENCFWTEA